MTYNVHIDQVYKIGQFNECRSRAVFISFVRVEDREKIFRSRTELSKSQSHYNVCINDDVRPRTRRTQNILRQVMQELKASEGRCTGIPSSVTINGKRYDAKNVDTLPEEYTLEKLKTKQINGNVIAYHSEHPRSQIYTSAK